MGKFLEQWVDTGLDRDLTWTPDGERVRQQQRLADQAVIMLYLIEMPTRLPEDAGRGKRAHDKKLARQVLNRLLTGMRAWGDTDPDATLDAMITHDDPENSESYHAQAMRLTWPEWWENHKSTLTLTMRRVATQAHKNSEVKTGNKFMNSLRNEYATLDDLQFDPENQSG